MKKRILVFFIVIIFLNGQYGILLALAPFRTNSDGTINQMSEEGEIIAYVQGNLEYFINAFTFYKKSGILTESGLLLLNQAKELRKGMSGFSIDLYKLLYHVIKYFRSISSMSREDLIQQFPQWCFRQLRDFSIGRFGGGVALKFIEGCSNACVFCPVQRRPKNEIMPLPLIIMIAGYSGTRNIRGVFLAEPLLYEDPCGALYHDVTKVYREPSSKNKIIIHGYSGEDTSTARKNIEEIKKHAGDYNRITISIHPVDVNYFTFLKNGRSEDDIVTHYIERYVSLIKELDAAAIPFIKLIFMYPYSPPAVIKYENTDRQIQTWALITDRIKEGILGALEDSGLHFDKRDKYTCDETESKRTYEVDDFELLSQRAHRYYPDEKWLFWSGAGTQFMGNAICYYIDPAGNINALLPPGKYYFSNSLCNVPLDERDRSVIFKALDDNVSGYRDLLWNIVHLQKHPNSELRRLVLELDNLVSDYGRYDSDYWTRKKFLINSITDLVIKLNLPIPIDRPQRRAIHKAPELIVYPLANIFFEESIQYPTPTSAVIDTCG